MLIQDLRKRIAEKVPVQYRDCFLVINYKASVWLGKQLPNSGFSLRTIYLGDDITVQARQLNEFLDWCLEKINDNPNEFCRIQMFYQSTNSTLRVASEHINVSEFPYTYRYD